MRRGFTVVELLVVIAIIGVLMALTLPAIQYVREGARKTQCATNLKQIAMGAIAHNSTWEYFPNAGGNDGASRSMTPNGALPQPAIRQDWGVFYQILPYIEQKPAYDLTNDAQVAGTLVKIYFCPTRRKPTAVSGSSANGLLRTDLRGGVDYAGNGGEIGRNPMNQLVPFMIGPSAGYTASLSYQNGAIIPRPFPGATVSERITGTALSDGLSNILMFGERNYNRKPSGTQLDEDNGFINGWSVDTIRFGIVGRPVPDRVTFPYDTRFGGPHSGVVILAMCDGSVKPMAYSAVDDIVFRQLCNRADKKFPTLP